MTPHEPAPTLLGAWLDQHTARAPEALRRRLGVYVAEAPSSSGIASALAAAATAALGRVLAHPGDRSVAIDLLTADALLTLALLAQAEHDPGGLARFADGLLHLHRSAE